MYQIDIIENEQVVKSLHPKDKLEANRLYYHWSGIQHNRYVRFMLDGNELGYSAARAYLGPPSSPIRIVYGNMARR